MTPWPPRFSLVVCTILVLLAHAAVISSLGKGQGSSAGDSPRPLARRPVSLVRVAAPKIPTLDTVMTRAAPHRMPPVPITRAEREPGAGVASSDDGAGDSTTATPVGAAIYRPGADLDVPARPRSAPDLAMLSGLAWSGVPLRMRLFIDRHGVVVDTQVLQSAEAPDVIERVRTMFLSTSFTAGLVKGEPVPCFKDIELNVGAGS